jgi:hypothetical protein
MHVDEVQIDGSRTEAVIATNMENPGKRLIVLEGGGRGSKRSTNSVNSQRSINVAEIPRKSAEIRIGIEAALAVRSELTLSAGTCKNPLP